MLTKSDDTISNKYLEYLDKDIILFVYVFDNSQNTL